MPPRDELMPPLEEVLYSGYIGQGKKVDEYEKKLSVILGTENVLTVNSGTSALQLAMRLAGIREGKNGGRSEVITTPMTCTATNMPILAENGIPVWADVDPTTGLIDPIDVERKITPFTRAIVAVDWGGTPCDYEQLGAIGKKYGLWVIQDAAHSWGATYKGKPVGSYDGVDFACLSTQAIKHITTIDGGILTCNDSRHYKKGKLLRWYGIDRETDRKDLRCEEDVLDWGYKFHMNDVAATIGLVQLDHLSRISALHSQNAAFFRAHITSAIRTAIPSYAWGPESNSGFWLYTLLMPSSAVRDRFVDHMTEVGVHVSRVHARNDTHTTFRQNAAWHPLPGVDQFSSRMICIPVNHGLTKEDRERIVEAVNSFVLKELRVG